MQAVLSLITNKDDFIIRVKCPFCGDEDMQDGQNCQCDDYVDPCVMLWCDSCIATSIINSPVEEGISIWSNVETIEKTIGNPFKTIVNGEEIIRQYGLSLCFVMRVINSTLSKYILDENTQNISQDSVRKFIENGYENPESFGIRKQEIDPSEETDNEMDFRLSVDCNSYNIETPKKNYPKGFEMDHDGVYVYAQCVTLAGKVFIQRYWGD